MLRPLRHEVRGGAMSFDSRILAEIERRASVLTACARSVGLRRQAMVRCARDPLFWFDNFAWSYDLRRPPHHLPLILWDEQRELVCAFLGSGDAGRDDHGNPWPLLVEKSRDQGASVLLTCAPVWDWLFNEAANYGIMTRRAADLYDGTADSLFGKVEYCISMLPRWMLRGYAPETHRRLQPLTIKHPATGSVLSGETTTGNAFRGRRLKRVLIDEAAHIPKMDQILIAVSGTTDAPCMASSVRGRGGAFAQHAHGDTIPMHDYGDTESPGWRKVRLHYSDDPRRDAEWADRKRATMTKEAWAQEYEIDYDASVPGRIWPEFDRSRHVYSDEHEWFEFAGQFLGRAVHLEGWDFGSGESLTAVVWAFYLPSEDTIYCRDYRAWRESRFDEVACDVGAAGYACDANPRGVMPHRRLGDTAGKQRGSDQRSWIINLRDEGIHIQGKRIGHQEALFGRMRVALAQDRILFHPDCDRRYTKGLPTLVESVSQYRRDMKTTEHVGDTPKPRKDRYSHLADALQYIVADVWPASGTIDTRRQDP
jgi:hypothetical protein